MLGRVTKNALECEKGDFVFDPEGDGMFTYSQPDPTRTVGVLGCSCWESH